MNMKRRAKILLTVAAGIGVVLTVSTDPVMAYDGRHHGYEYAGGYYGQGHGIRYRFRHRPPRYYVVADHPPPVIYPVEYAYPVATHAYVPYRQPHGTLSRYRGSSPNFGNALGGALGGYLGSKIGQGSGQLAATAAGAVIGYAVGGRVGAQY